MKKVLASCLAIILIIVSTPTMIFTVSAEETTYNVGDIIEFGSYKQSAIKNENNETIGFKGNVYCRSCIADSFICRTKRT